MFESPLKRVSKKIEARKSKKELGDECLYSPKILENKIICEFYDGESFTCTKALDKSYCGEFNRLSEGKNDE